VELRYDKVFMNNSSLHVSINIFQANKICLKRAITEFYAYFITYKRYYNLVRVLMRSKNLGWLAIK